MVVIVLERPLERWGGRASLDGIEELSVLYHCNCFLL